MRITRVHLIAGLFVVAVGLSATYVATGADLFLRDLPYTQARERMKLVFGGLGALAAPISLWVALTAYQLNARLASMNSSARLDPVPETAGHQGDTRRVRYPGGRNTDLAACEIQFTNDPGDGGEKDDLFCAVPLVNIGPARATIVSATASLDGLPAPRCVMSSSAVLANQVVFLGFAWKGAAARLGDPGPELRVSYRDGVGGKLELTATVRNDGDHRWQLEALGQENG